MKCLLICVFGLICISCSTNKKTNPKSYIAFIDGQGIEASELDALIQDQLYESLFGIYYKRRIALEEMIGELVLQKEASIQRLSRDELVQKIMQDSIKSETKLKFIDSNRFGGFLQDPNNPFKQIDIKSRRGDSLVIELMKQKILERYILYLETKYKTEINLNPPLPPKRDFTAVKGIEATNNEDGFEIIMISNFECPSCKAAYPIIKGVLNKYKDKVQFKYVHFSSSASFAIKTLEYAKEKGKFWEASDELFRMENLDSASIVSRAEEMSLDINELVQRFQDESRITYNVANNFQLLSNLGIKLTPTIVIDGRIYYGAIELDAISRYIDDSMRNGNLN